MIPAPLIALGQLVIGGITKHFERKQELKQAEHEAKVQRVREGDTNAARLDEMSIAQRGWKDEYLLLITTFPVVLLFFAPLFEVSSPAGVQAAVEAGFKALEKTPEYYWYALAIVYIDTFGFRRMLRTAFEGWVSKKFGGS